MIIARAEADYEPHDMTGDRAIDAADVAAENTASALPDPVTDFFEPIRDQLQKTKEACARARQLVIETDRLVARARAHGIDVPEHTPTANRVVPNPNDLIDAWLIRNEGHA